MTKEENPEYFKKKRELAEKEANDDLTKSKERIFTDIHDESLAVPEERPPEITIARTMARFAALLIRLSKDSDVTADKNLRISEINLDIAKTNLKLQKWVIFFTILALILAFIAVLPIFNHLNRSGDTTHQTNAPTGPNK